VRLILGGALDSAGEAELGARLGVSGRHLRRLFAEHVGATPDQVARSSRAHFARRLLDDTDLRVTDVAYAAGFGSPRQFNRACLAIFRASPRELRARRRVSDRLAADGGLALRLPFAGPLDWAAMLDYFALRAIPGVEAVAGDRYRRTVVIDGDPGVLEVMPGGDDHLVLVAHLPHWDGLIHVVERVRRMVGLDRPGGGGDAASVLGADPVLAPLLAGRPGMRVPGAWSPFEVGVRAIVGQQVSVAAASTVTGRLVARHGAPVGGLAPLGLSHTFPSAATLAAADLDGLGLTRGRAAAIRGFAAAVAAGDVPLDGSLTLDDLVGAIVAVPGLGPWTAHYVALRLGERDAFPATDLGLVRALARLDGDGPALVERAEAWRPWRALAAVHLWAAPAGVADEAQPAAEAPAPSAGLGRCASGGAIGPARLSRQRRRRPATPPGRPGCRGRR
jgi:AraC family transcriptional regulator of adaptative response / DNA-3-methyladenine glycosylase II